MKTSDSQKRLVEIAAAAKAAGMSYGKYVAMKREKDTPPRDKPRADAPKRKGKKSHVKNDAH